AGFSGDGFLKNVENVNLTNSGTIARTFTATGVEGVEQYNLTGAVNLAGISDAAATIAIADRSSDLSVQYANKALDGKADVLNLSTTNVGTVANEETETAIDSVAINVSTGFETLALTTAGDNALDLAGV